MPSLVVAATVLIQDEAANRPPPNGEIHPHPLSKLVRPIEADKRGDHDATIYRVTGRKYLQVTLGLARS